MPFTALRLIEPLLRAVQSEGYTIPTDIQKQAIPHVLAGKDLMGCAQTGTGKTAAFALPILQRLSERPPAKHAAHGQPSRTIRALVITPTRELAAQIGESFRVYGQNLPLRHTVIYGGVRQGPQTLALHRGVDILVATPGRLLDLLHQRRLTLQHVEVFVLDEADRMLDMGFIHDIRRVLAQLPQRRQTLMFSATLPREIRGLANTILNEPLYVKVASESPAADTVEQALYYVDAQTKGALLELLLSDPQITRSLVFTRTKHGADKVVRKLIQAGINAQAIHSNKCQNARLKALADFKSGRTRVLVASDIAARGLDVDDISHVINYDLPNVAEMYVHRIGRTGRAGAAGQAISFCGDDQHDDLREIEKLLGGPIPVLHHGLKSLAFSVPDPRQSGGSRRGPGQGHARGGGDHAAQAAPAAAVQGEANSADPEKAKSAFWGSRRRRPKTGFGKIRLRKRR